MLVKGGCGVRTSHAPINGFSKKLENLEAAVGLHFAHYNYVRRHQTLVMLFLSERGMDRANTLLGYADSSFVVGMVDARIVSDAMIVRDVRHILLREFESDDDVQSVVRAIGAPVFVHRPQD